MCARDDVSHLMAPQDEEITCNQLSLSEQRACVFHLLYAMEAFDYSVSLESIAENLSRGFAYTIRPEDALFKQALAIIAHRQELDAHIIPLLDKWRFERLGMCTRLIIRLALWELINTPTEPSIIINEAIELAKCFAETDAYKFVNGILDEWVKKKKQST
ncbi:MAG: transcription antitermination factor NusB [Candidatus Babeliaceae bacterium]